MTDIFFKEFYDSVRGTAWPDVDDYRDFQNLDPDLQQECWQQHDLIGRLSTIEDPDYWAAVTTPVMCHENLAFVPVAKCASTYYKNLFLERLGWHRIDNISDTASDAVLFGCVQHPIERYLKGVTEFVHEHALGTHPNIDAILDEILISDIHTMPYCTKMGQWINRVYWIPMDIMSDDSVKIAMMNLFRKHGHTISLPLGDAKLYQSSPDKINLYHRVRQRFCLKPQKIYFLYAFLAQDLKFYRQLADRFRIDWSHIN